MDLVRLEEREVVAETVEEVGRKAALRDFATASNSVSNSRT